jgi:hypothetical protein
LASRGYAVVAFEPASALVASLAQFCNDLPIEVFVGRYEQLPMVRMLSQPMDKIDLRSRAPFAAAILGWTSFSNLRSDAHCIETLKQFGKLTHGPILVSYYPSNRGSSGARFSYALGYYRTFSGPDFRTLAERASLSIIDFDDDDNWPYAVLQA